MEVVLKTENLTKKFKEKIAVNHINMTIKRGDIYGFIGKNGAGKTSTMKLILGMNFPDSGHIELFESKNLDQARKKIGSLIEAPGLYKNCTAYENMRRFAILSGGTEQEIKEYLNLVGLANTGNKKAKDFSLGMRQRLGIAIALLGHPELLMLDEPINGLDPEGIKEIRDVILTLNRKKGVTFLISSHLLDELAKIVTRYGIINNGVLLEEITAQQLEQRCQSGLKIVCNHSDTAADLLRKKLSASDISVNGDTILLQSKTEFAGKINTLLVQNGIEVREIALQQGGFEEYFIERIGR